MDGRPLRQVSPPINQQFAYNIEANLAAALDVDKLRLPDNIHVFAKRFSQPSDFPLLSHTEWLSIVAKVKRTLDAVPHDPSILAYPKLMKQFYETLDSKQLTAAQAGGVLYGRELRAEQSQLLSRANVTSLLAIQHMALDQVLSKLQGLPSSQIAINQRPPSMVITRSKDNSNAANPMSWVLLAIYGSDGATERRLAEIDASPGSPDAQHTIEMPTVDELRLPLSNFTVLEANTTDPLASKLSASTGVATINAVLTLLSSTGPVKYSTEGGIGEREIVISSSGFTPKQFLAAMRGVYGYRWSQASKNEIQLHAPPVPAVKSLRDLPNAMAMCFPNDLKRYLFVGRPIDGLITNTNTTSAQGALPAGILPNNSRRTFLVRNVPTRMKAASRSAGRLLFQMNPALNTAPRGLKYDSLLHLERQLCVTSTVLSDLHEIASDGGYATLYDDYPPYVIKPELAEIRVSNGYMKVGMTTVNGLATHYIGGGAQIGPMEQTPRPRRPQ